MTLTPGSRLDAYEVLAKLGEGGMGEVYRARDTRLQREVAIKVVSGGAADSSRLDRFQQEARATAALNHPHILAVYDVGAADVAGVTTPYVVSELLAGETLRAVGHRVSRRRDVARHALGGPCLLGRVGRGDDARDRECGAAGLVGPRSWRARRPRAHRSPLPGERPRAALPVRARFGIRPGRP